MAYVIAGPCIGTKDTACIGAFPLDCIHLKKNTTYNDGRPGFEKVPQLSIDPAECADCRACVPCARSLQFLRLMIFPRNGNITLKSMRGTSKVASSRRTKTPSARRSSCNRTAQVPMP
jgi:NAD-dependent dihydropyrimidine dehydrogenase PreA subunit